MRREECLVLYFDSNISLRSIIIESAGGCRCCYTFHKIASDNLSPPIFRMGGFHNSQVTIRIEISTHSVFFDIYLQCCCFFFFSILAMDLII